MIPFKLLLTNKWILMEISWTLLNLNILWEQCRQVVTRDKHFQECPVKLESLVPLNKKIKEIWWVWYNKVLMKNMEREMQTKLSIGIKANLWPLKDKLLTGKEDQSNQLMVYHHSHSLYHLKLNLKLTGCNRTKSDITKIPETTIKFKTFQQVIKRAISLKAPLIKEWLIRINLESLKLRISTLLLLNLCLIRSLIMKLNIRKTSRI